MSEPRVLFLGGNRRRWSAKDKLAQASTMNGIEAWVFACGGDYIQGKSANKKDLEGYDIIIANSNPAAWKRLSQLVNERPASSKWVTMIEGDASLYIHPKPYIRDLLDSSDLVNCINKYSEPFFKKFTTSKAEYIGIPYPAEGIRALSTPIDSRRREIFIAQMLSRRWTGYLMLKEMDYQVYGYEKKLSRNPGMFWKNFRQYRTSAPEYLHDKVRALYREPDFKILQEESIPDFFKRNGGAFIWLNLDGRYTWARYVLDAAALQVPIVTTHSTGHAEKFFPRTMVENEFEIDTALDLVQKLFSDMDFYNEVASVPLELFDELRPEVMKKKLLQSLYS